MSLALQTTGIGVAAAVTVSGTGIAKAVSSSGNPGVTSEYTLTLSLSATGGHASTCQLTTVVTDVAGTTVTGTPTYICYNDPVFINFNPKVNGAGSGYPVQTNTYAVVSVSLSGGLITALGVGQALVEIQVPFAGNTLGNYSAINQGDSVGSEVKQMIYAQINVQVIP